MTLHKLINSALLPAKLIVPQPIVAKIPYLTTNEDIRLSMALRWTRGKVLDIGCGHNRFIQRYRALGGEGLGVDVYDWGSQDMLVQDTADLPFDDETFDSVTMIACINHIPNREDVLSEAHRVLEGDGRLVVTNLEPLISTVWHKFAFWDDDQHERGMKEGECYGLKRRYLQEIAAASGFILKRRKRFSLCLNSIYLYGKR